MSDMEERSKFAIIQARTAADFSAAAALFRAYAASLGVDLAYQNFATELAALPGAYAPPAGELLLARTSEDAAVGCVALRPMQGAGCCEMKRLYVSPAARGTGLGRRLVGAIVERARRIGYREIRLDTLPTMTDAIALYGKLGFTTTPPYYDTPIAGTVFMARMLDGLSAP